MDEAVMWSRLAAARVGRLATVTPEGTPHLVPCCFAVLDGVIVSAVDAKPKSTAALRRLDNIRGHPGVSLLVDHYDDADWNQLWWVRVDGTARVVTEGLEREAALEALVAKYPQYRAARPSGAVIVVEHLTGRAWP